MPEALLPGEPHCAPASTVITESVSSLLRTLYADQSWNSAVSSAIVDRLQHVDSLANLLSHECRDSVSSETDKLIGGDDIVDVESSDKTASVRDDVIETAGKKHAPLGTFS